MRSDQYAFVECQAEGIAGRFWTTHGTKTQDVSRASEGSEPQVYTEQEQRECHSRGFVCSREVQTPEPQPGGRMSTRLPRGLVGVTSSAAAGGDCSEAASGRGRAHASWVWLRGGGALTYPSPRRDFARKLSGSRIQVFPGLTISWFPR